jgi:uncharacterized membrane protein HdeD (DUF308 family)
MSGRDPAVARWAAIQLVRFLGVACVLVGILIVARRVATLSFLPDWLGYVLIASGLIDVFLVPTLLARRWRSPAE